MSWWRRFKAWLDEDPHGSPLKDWKPGPIIWLHSDPPTRVEWSDVAPSGSDAAATAGPSSTTDGVSDPVSAVKNESGERRT